MHNLHSPNLFETRYGHVLQCTCCDRIQVTFRQHTLLIDEEEFEVLTRTLRRTWRQVQDAEGQNQWRLQAGTDAGDVSLLLPEPSLRALHELLEGAWAMYELQKQLQALASGPARGVLKDYSPSAHSRWSGMDRSS